METVSGFVFGIAGSIHCIGMCGPIVLALPDAPQNLGIFTAGRVLYNLGRVVTYTLMGALVGLLGAGLLLPIFQQYLSIAAGALLVTTVALQELAGITATLPSFLASPLRRLQGTMGMLLKRQSLMGLFGLGILNGFLPCGFVYVAMTAAAVTADIFGGMLFMAGFGLGTIPAMLAFAYSPKFLSTNATTKIARILPYFTLLVGVLLIVRGLNLGIPFISPKLSGAGTSPIVGGHH